MKFSEVAKQALEHRAKTKKYRNERSLQRWEQVLRLHLNPYIGNKDIKKIDSDTIVDVLSIIWDKHTPTGQITRSVLDYILGYAIHKHLRPASDFNPAKWKDALKRPIGLMGSRQRNNLLIT